MLKVLITGSTGFIGSNLNRRLPRESFEIIGLSRRIGPDIATLLRGFWKRKMD
jgi:nucleoside-diphosphate-sugar epimerase